MGDPLSVSASITGIVSLAITVCSGILQYYASYKDAHDDIASIYALVDDLSKTFNFLDGKLQESLFSSDAVDRVTESIVACAGGVQKLKDKLDKARMTKPGGNPHLRRAQWPFRETTVLKLQRVTSDLRANLILAIQVFQVEATTSTLDKLRLMDTKLDAVITRSLKADDMKILEWLSPVDFRARQNDALSRRSGETGTWFLERSEFIDWVSGSTNILWCPGVPGAGKTVLSSVVINHLERAFGAQKVGIAYIYCSYNDQLQTVRRFLGSVLRQLIQRNPLLLSDLWSCYQSHERTNTRPTDSDLITLLQKQTQQYEKVFVVIDALDECTESSFTRKDLLDRLLDLVPDIRLLVTSRHIASIESRFRSECRVEISANEEDIKAFVLTYIERTDQLRELLEGSNDLHNTIIDSVLQKTGGMFLLAALHMDSLAKEDNIRDIRENLRNLPKDLDATYDDALQRIHNQDRRKVIRAEQVITWICCAETLLSVDELCCALAIRFGDSQLDLEALPKTEPLLSACCGLVTLDHERQVFTLVHYTTEEYLKKNQKYCGPDAHAYLAGISITYLGFSFFDRSPLTDVMALGAIEPWEWQRMKHEKNDARNEVENFLQVNKVLKYAVNHWGDHARETFSDSESCSGQATGASLATSTSPTPSLIETPSVQDLVLEFVKRKQNQIRYADQLGKWVRKELVHHDFMGGAEIMAMREAWSTSNVTTLQVVASFGILPAVNLLLKEGAYVNESDSNGQTALHKAVMKGHTAVVQRLASTPGIELDVKDFKKFTPLHYALAEGHIPVGRLLLEKGASALRKPNQWEINEILEGHTDEHCEEIVKLLMDHTAKPRHQAALIREVLPLAILKKRPALANYCLATGAGTTAAISGSPDKLGMMKMLQTSGASIATDTQKEILILAVLDGDLKLMQLILDLGVSPNDFPSAPRTPLGQAAYWGDINALHWLLDRSADPNIRDRKGNTPLHLLWRDHVIKTAFQASIAFCTKALVSKCADVEAKNLRGHSPLLVAVSNANVDVVGALLEYGADPEALPEDLQRFRKKYAPERLFERAVKLVMKARRRGRRDISEAVVWPLVVPQELAEVTVLTPIRQADGDDDEDIQLV